MLYRYFVTSTKCHTLSPTLWEYFFKDMKFFSILFVLREQSSRYIDKRKFVRSFVRMETCGGAAQKFFSRKRPEGRGIQPIGSLRSPLNMSQKTLILYDLKGKTNAQKTKILRKLYNYREISNYDYSYKREGTLAKIQIEKTKKTVLRIINKNDVPKVVELLKELEVEFEIAKA